MIEGKRTIGSNRELIHLQLWARIKTVEGKSWGARGESKHVLPL